MATKEPITLPQPPETPIAATAPFIANGFHNNTAPTSQAMASEDGRLVSEEEYWADYYEHPAFSYEWNDGKLEVKPVTTYAQYRAYLWFLALVRDYLHIYQNARMIGLEMGFRMRLRRRTAIRKPDLAIVLNSNPIPLGDQDRSYRGIFDLCIESLSNSTKKEIERDTIHKKLEYAQAGVREYFILDENGTETAFYQLSHNRLYVPIPAQNGIIHSQVLPGFQFRASDLYTLPEPPQLIDDPVYRHYSSPYVHAERIRAEQAEERAALAVLYAERQEREAELQERQAKLQEQRAEQAERQVAEYEALLKSHGIALPRP